MSPLEGDEEVNLEPDNKDLCDMPRLEGDEKIEL